MIAILAGLAAGACFAAGGMLQHREANRLPAEESLSLRLLADLLRRRVWLAGIGLAVLSYVFKSVALTFGPLSVVQPLIASEVLFAVPASFRRHGMKLGVREWGGAAAVVAGLSLGIVSASPEQGVPLVSPLQWVEALAVVLGLASGAVLIGRRINGPVRASLFALASGALLAAQGALLAATVALFQHGVVTALTSWQPYGMAVASLWGLTLVQSAYQAGPLAASMPVMDVANPLIAATIGVVIFGEEIQTGIWHLTGLALGLVMLFGGIIALDTSPLVAREQRVECQENEGRDG